MSSATVPPINAVVQAAWLFRDGAYLRRWGADKVALMQRTCLPEHADMCFYKPTAYGKTGASSRHNTTALLAWCAVLGGIYYNIAAENGTVQLHNKSEHEKKPKCRDLSTSATHTRSKVRQITNDVGFI